jgi:hypothetical protein
MTSQQQQHQQHQQQLLLQQQKQQQQMYQQQQQQLQQQQQRQVRPYSYFSNRVTRCVCEKIAQNVAHYPALQVSELKFANSSFKNLTN